MKTRNGFTLMEIMVVVVLLGILAVIVVPQFSSATMQAQTSALRKDLQTVRKQIELYEQQHNETGPAAAGETGVDFERRMTTQTDAEGAVGTDYGPYLERMPTNPFNNLDTVRVGGAPAGINAQGWRFDPATGQFQADDAYDRDHDGVADHASF